MRKILILTGRYLPGHKDGGPLRTILNLTEALGDEYEFYIACLDRDLGDTAAYSNISKNQWNKVGKAKVWYTEPGGFSFSFLRNLTDKVDLVYVCGFYNDYAYKTLILNRLHKIKKPVVVASMGVFSKGALSYKPLKKKVYIFALKILGLLNDIEWSVTSEIEANDLKNVIGNDINYVIAEDLPRDNVPGFTNRNLDEKSAVFLSRISPKKNLLGALKALEGLKDNISFGIYGPIEDHHYWELCKNKMDILPNNIRVQYYGDIPSEQVQETMSKYNVFLFPTFGENYGHVIFEALSVGCIPIISDQTPWREIEDMKAGIVLPLTENMSNFTKAIAGIFNESEENKRRRAEAAVQIAMNRVSNNKKETGYRRIFG